MKFIVLHNDPNERRRFLANTGPSSIESFADTRLPSHTDSELARLPV
jgi:hypothetical protein